MRSLSHSFSPWCDGEENWKKKVKLVGWDKNHLTEQQREKKIIAIILIKKNIQSVIFPLPDAHLAPKY